VSHYNAGPMRFLMLNWRDPKNPLAGGAERVSLRYLKALVGRGHEVTWFANHFQGALREEVFDGIRFVRGGGKGTSVLEAIRWYRRQPRFDLVIDQHHGIPWYAPWWCRTSCVAYIHEVLGPIWNSFYPWPLSAVGRLQEHWTHWFYRNVPFWTPSESTATTLRTHGVKEITVIPNGCDTAPLPALDPKPLQPPVRLITVSRLAPNKRIDHAIHLTQLLNYRGIPTHLTVVGTGEMENQLRQLAGRLSLGGKIVFTGALPESDKNARLREAHLLVHTSVREGWGLNVIEANAMGTPAVVYPVGGLVDSTVHGRTGVISHAETSESLADEVVKLVDSPQTYDALRDGAWERAKGFQWEHVLPRACDWLEQCGRRQL
jgi:glycosyltransferase involved in cell wall biosynthesis